MYRKSAPLLFALAVLWITAPGCGSGGDDLFQGDAGSAAQPDASVDTGKGGTSGQAGAPGSGGIAGEGGGATGGQGGGAAGESGGSGTGGTSGSAGSPSTGGSSGAGGALAIGCESLCDGSFCQGATATDTCLNCLNGVCKEIGDLYTYASDLQSYQYCIQNCSESGCYDDCCDQNPRACWSGKLWSGCSCGWDETECESVCGEACSGGFMDESCQDCVKPSPCGLALYKYHFTSQAGEYSNCRNECDGDVPCEQSCCSQYPQPCAARQTAIDCVCK